MGHDHAHLPVTDADRGLRRRASTISLAVGVVMLALKTTAWLLTGSATVLSDALESVVHVAAVSFMFWAMRYSAAPPDAEHPYGHGKAEYFSVGFEGGAIALAAAAIAWEAVTGLWRGHEPGSIDAAIMLVVAAAVINLVLGWWLLRVGRRTRSTILVADGHHVLSDVWTTGGVLIGLGLLWLLPPGPARVWCDALVALVLAVVILVVGFGLMRQAMRGLLDESDPAEVARVVAAINAAQRPEWVDVHNLRVRRSGDHVFVDFHLVVPGAWSVARAHVDLEILEQAILTHLGSPGSVLIHLDHDTSPEYIGLRTTASRWPLTVEAATVVEQTPG